VELVDDGVAVGVCDIDSDIDVFTVAAVLFASVLLMAVMVLDNVGSPGEVKADDDGAVEVAARGDDVPAEASGLADDCGGGDDECNRWCGDVGERGESGSLA